MPAILISIVSWVQLAASLGQEITPIIKAAKAFINSLFDDDVITKAQQDAVMAEIDRIAQGFANGIPEWWAVEPDPE